jgi:hypothetical protein
MFSYHTTRSEVRGKQIIADRKRSLGRTGGQTVYQNGVDKQVAKLSAEPKQTRQASKLQLYEMQISPNCRKGEEGTER